MSIPGPAAGACAPGQAGSSGGGGARHAQRDRACIPPRAFDGRRVLLLVLTVFAGVTLLATPSLIVPWPQEAPWYESPGTFPRFALMLVMVGALVELWRRKQQAPDAGSEEMDASASRPGLMLISVALFIAYSLAAPVLGFLSSTLLFVLITGRTVGLSWRISALIAMPLAVVLWLVFVKVLHIAFGGWL